MYLISYFSLIAITSSVLDSIIEFIVNHFLETTIIGIVVGVVSLLIGEVLLAHWKKPKFVIEASNKKQGKLGFSVYVRKKEVKEATVRCNDIKYQWEKEDGATTCEQVNLRIGDSPVSFYPFNIDLRFVEDLSHLRNVWAHDSPRDIEHSGGVVLSVTEPATGKTVYQVAYAVPRHARAFIVFAPWPIQDVFNVRIRIVGEGIEEESEYILGVGLNNLIIHPIRDGQPLMEYVDWGFEVKKASKFFYRRKRAKFIYQI